MPRRSVSQRAQDPIVDPQDGLFDQIVEDPSLEMALERRQLAKEARDAADSEKSRFKDADAAAKGLIAALELEPDTIVRVGRFRLKYQHRDGSHVEFDVAARNQLSISLIS